ncbi:MAG: hypothetical protein ACTSRS_19305 [Candidatus Helarchaeota archaeon]
MMATKSIMAWYIVLSRILNILPLLLPINFLRVTCGRSCGLRGIDELF